MLRFIFFLFVVLTQLQAEEPAWLLLQKGWDALRKKDISNALSYFRGARKSRTSYPDADFGIGIAYEAELNYPLAIRQYKIALDQVQDFENQEYQYLVHYHLARLMWIQENFSLYEQELTLIINDEAQFSNNDKNWLRRSLHKSTKHVDVSRLLTLYRLDSGFAFAAHRELGIYLTLSGRDTALDHLLFAYIHAASKMIKLLQIHIPEYTYKDLSSLLHDMSFYEEIQKYQKESFFYRILYYLAIAYRSYDPISLQAKTLLTLLSKQPDTQEWGRKAARQLKESYFPLKAAFYPQIPTAY